MELKQVPFTELLSRIVDNRGKTCPTAPEGLPLIATNCIKNDRLYPTYETNRFISQETYRTWFRGHPDSNDLLFVTKGSPGRVCLVPDPVDFCIAQDMVAIKPDPEKVYPPFLLALLRSAVVQEQIVNMHVGTLIPHFKKGDFDKLILSLPSKETQRFVGDLYFCCSQKIDLNQKQNVTLEAMAQAIFKSWFVDFDPVKAKAEGRQPEGMDATTAALFPSDFEESELGMMPSGWLLRSIGDISEILNGFAFKSEDYVDENSGIFVLRTTNFSADGYAERLDKDVFLPIAFKESYKKFLCNSFDFHLVMVGASVGRTSTLLPHMLPAFRNQNMWCFRPKDNFISKFFIHEIVKLKVVEALRSTSGSAREFLRKGDFEKNKFMLPDQRILSVFEHRISILKNKIAVNEHQSLVLTKIRDTLLPRLISGKLRVGDDKQIIKDVA